MSFMDHFLHTNIPRPAKDGSCNRLDNDGETGDRLCPRLRAFRHVDVNISVLQESRVKRPLRRKHDITNICHRNCPRGNNLSSSPGFGQWTYISWLHFLFLTVQHGEWHPSLAGALILNAVQFYSEAILSRRGPLAKVWLAAHMERKLSKTQTLQTDIEQAAGKHSLARRMKARS